METRLEKILACIDPANQVGLEIGALNKPIVTPEMGDIRYVDHATTAELQAKYAADPNVETENIVEVSYVWGEKRLIDLVGETRFDYVLASHVIEHVPDLIGWLKEIHAVLKPGGVLSLAIPDKRYCFDYFRQPTQPADVVDAYLSNQRKPGPRQIFDFYSSVSHWQGQFAWGQDPEPEPTAVTRYHLPAAAWQLTQQAVASEAYHDVHCWVFTPESFFELLKLLIQINLFDFKLSRFEHSVGCEFHVTLEAVDLGKDQELNQQSQLESIVSLGLTSEVSDLKDSSQQQTAEQSKQLASVQTNLKRLRTDKQRLRKKVAHLQKDLTTREAKIAAMQSSKFWKLRAKWMRIKQLLSTFALRTSSDQPVNFISDQEIEGTVSAFRVASTAIENRTNLVNQNLTNQPVKLHLGCGSHVLSGWLNMDIDVEQSNSSGVLQHDLTQPLPFPSDSIEFIFSEYFIEHITHKAARQLLIECHRVLKPNSIIRISTPDLKKLVDEYLSKTMHEWKDMGWVPTTPCQMMNQGIRLWGHQFLYDAEELSILLKEAGFRQVMPVDWRASDHSQLRNLEVRPFHQEVIVEAVK